MKRSGLFAIICLAVAAALLLAGCSKDEMGEAGTTLSDGAYPLEIGSVSITAEADEGSSTRVSENSDGASSVFVDGDKIKVQIGEGTVGTYTYTDGSWAVAESESPAYWKSTAAGQTITAWYASGETDGSVDLSDQSTGLAYVLQASTTANFNASANLTFSHQLAKVRVKLSGTAASSITSVEIYSSTSCSFDPTTTTLTAGEEQGYIKMLECSYDGVKCWEANVVPGEISSGAFIRLNGSTIASISGITSLEAGKVHVVDVAIYNEGEVPVSTEDDLIAAVATDNAQIILTGAIELSSNLSVTGSGVTIDLNGYSITNSLFNVESGASLTIEDGSVEGTGTIGSSFNMYGTLTINGGTFGGNIYNYGATTINGGTFNDPVVCEGGEIMIYGGEFNSNVNCRGGNITIEDGTFNYSVNTDGGTIEIHGGTFNDHVPYTGSGITISGGTFYNYEPASDLIAKGYKVTTTTDNSGTACWVVEPE